jgi:hypothetical protein
MAGTEILTSEEVYADLKDIDQMRGNTMADDPVNSSSRYMGRSKKKATTKR